MTKDKKRLAESKKKIIDLMLKFAKKVKSGKARLPPVIDLLNLIRKDRAIQKNDKRNLC